MLEKKITAFSLTAGQQGGIGYPPEIVKYKNKWWFVEDSRNHGGDMCYQCSEARGIKYGFIPQRFGQPKAYGSACYRSLVPKADTRPSLKQVYKRYMPWETFVAIVRNQYGEPEVMERKPC